MSWHVTEMRRAQQKTAFSHATKCSMLRCVDTNLTISSLIWLQCRSYVCPGCFFCILSFEASDSFSKLILLLISSKYEKSYVPDRIHLFLYLYFRPYFIFFLFIFAVKANHFVNCVRFIWPQSISHVSVCLCFFSALESLVFSTNSKGGPHSQCPVR